ncbi:glucose-6-phosphate isomerase [Simiduia curdlanivorans]|uniref:Glucose-6-phosphate isomerase n=1 Tax=Simiduia curdlanivorans TaxID=1492769 RepID=A0ABV8V6P1_9GAMM|nr:glucose-6-phosphate isomerase [Simiduia curdlanivorans]MDN3639290.1 glucose-6-phosphate isomerase [Simiduia curdlanivorans]
MSSRAELPEWQNLVQHAAAVKDRSISGLFQQDAQRFSNCSRRVADKLYDFSKNNLCETTFERLLDLAKAVDFPAWRQQLWDGVPLNSTENRAVLHVALRDSSGRAYWVDGKNIALDVQRSLKQMRRFCAQVRSGQWLGYSGKTITDVVSIGIGGSNLGPQMACEALASYADDRLKVHFVSNVDGVQIRRVLADLDPERTLFVVASKTFTTRETLLNARTAKAWLLQQAGANDAVAKHFVAVTSAVAKAQAMGIAPENCFEMWDWVGGRFSLWSAIGLPVALYLGFDQFEQMLAGAYEVDRHFFETPERDNVPLLMALIGVWNNTFLNMPTQAILPYDQALKYLPAYLQQAEMESNGKTVNRAGESISYTTGAILWGQLGIDGQHAFYQLLHQGAHNVAADFIGSVTPVLETDEHHTNLLANLFAQTQALMDGVDEQAVLADLAARGLSEAEQRALAPHKVHRGNQPTSTLLMTKITPQSLGGLIALYEHKIFVQGVIWDVCSYDQWGVELGKLLANKLEPQLEGEEPPATQDGSTSGLIRYVRAQQLA